MDSSFYLKPQGDFLITHVPVSSLLGTLPVGFPRNEFFGCGHNLQLPRRRCKKLRLKSQSHYCKFIFRASLDWQPVVVVTAAFAAVSAATVVNFTYSRKRFDVEQISGRLILALAEQIRSTANWILKDSKLVRLRDNQVDKDMDAEINFRDTDISGETITAEASQSQANMVAPSAHYTLNTQTSETLNISTVSSLSSEPESSLLVGDFREVNPNAYEHHHNLVTSELPILLERINLDAAPPANDIQEEKDKFGRMKRELEEGDTDISDLIFRDFTCKELYMINGAPENLDNPSDNSLVEGSYTSTCNAILSTGMFEEERLPGYHNQGFLYEQNDSGNRKKSTGKGKHIFRHDRLNKFSPSFNPKRKHNNKKHDPSWQLRVYNQLLREGRLNDCIELLEDLEENGLLDMDKVYHGRFFEVCKSQKAVKEAFRFTRFIPNPTLSTFNMLMSVCASSQDLEGAFQVLQYVQEAGLSADCKLYTTLVSTCAKSGKVDTMFKVFHEMVNAGVEPNLHTYGALIDGCAKAAQVAKAFGAYGILRSKNVKPDRVVFNALITACGQSGAVDRAFDVLAEMRAELHPIDPDHVTIGALMKACAGAGQVDRVREVYNMIHEYGIRGNAELYTIAVNSCSDWDFACSVYDDMIRKGVAPDEVFISALIDVAGHAGKLDAAFEILQEAKAKGMHVGIISYSSLMGACCNAKDWGNALQLYEDIKVLNLKPTVSMMNALITALCDGDQLQKAMDALSDMKTIDISPNTITYSVLLVASEKKDDIEAGVALISQAKKDGVTPNLVMYRCLMAMCLRRFQTACSFGEPVLSFSPGQVQLNSKWTSLALMIYRETISNVAPTVYELSQVLGCLKLPQDVSVKTRLIENLGLNTTRSKGASIYSMIEGFGEYDPRAFSLIEEAASLGIIPVVSLKDSPIVVDVRIFSVHAAEVYLLTVLKGLKHRLAAGAKLPNVTILLPIENTQLQTSAGEKVINIAGRTSQAVTALLRRLGLSYQGNESYGKIRINGVSIRKWFQPKLNSPFSGKRMDVHPSLRYLGPGISGQQRKIRTGYLSLE